ncbi:probable protein S-acyltransferase 1 [Gastrolobium bilobum]|uniref:probable protein S-acyltransferase 1 n=1 Tax=Gastrolobium bilobum TaxID=150636 RepID=UPI002AAF3FCD|nr:probable protein S-acyltransferase 1 [Gastrolobium bilobum]
MNRRTRQTIPHHFHKYLKPGALARIRDSKISARSHRLNSLSQIPIHRPLSPPPSTEAQPQANDADNGFPFFVARIYGPRCPQRKKLMAAKSVLFVPVNPAADSPDLVIEPFGNDIAIISILLLLMEKEIEANEIEIEVMEPIALSGEMEEEGGETFERRDDINKYNEVENKVDCGNQSLMSILRAKLLKVKRLFKDHLLQYDVAKKLGTVRLYQVWPGRNVFFFHGRLICGPDPRGSMLTTVSIVLSSWIFVSYVGNDVPHHSALVVMFCVMLTFIVLINLVLVSTTDPGIIPRNDQESFEDGTKSKKVIVNGVEVKLKYCRICKIFRPPRSCHCAICDNCVERYDHHCPWIGQCIALRNHRFYMTLVIFALIFYVYIFAFSCWRLHQRKDGDGFLGLVKTCPETLALAAFGFIAIVFLGTLAIYHVYLIAINETAYENFRQRYVGSKSPYDRGILINLKEAFFVAVPPPRVDFRA